MESNSESGASADILTAKQSLVIDEQRWQRIRFGVSCLDRLTGGGLSSRGIVEIAGEAGSGKTQLALHLSLAAQLFSLPPKGVVYISTEHTFPSRRIVQMEQAMRQNSDKTNCKESNLTDNIFVEHLHNPVSLELCISERLSVLLENNPIRLLVIDSITAVYAEEQNYIERAHSFRRVVRALHALQERFDFGVVCTNQVRSVIDDFSLDDEKIVPALGLSWASLVHTRLQISRINGAAAQRTCRLLFSPSVPQGECYFAITERGISEKTEVR
ncbi:DNA repair protein XRCC3 [Sabethes cyaneus]|uniref:DNA repair protein XRCC3 n=1 Tax=Sabethes cyaneus TaxID=53552 RepID=UPI00237E9F28|nr:DNA repair protein XRCC3 [Sabethes cyaneus]XP_053687464.1 DNA repair protein XRCC3 [Sabethes cyaneus]